MSQPTLAFGGSKPSILTVMKLLLTFLLGISLSLNAFAQKKETSGIQVIYQHQQQLSPLQRNKLADASPELIDFLTKDVTVLVATSNEAVYEFKEKTMKGETVMKPLTEEQKKKIRSMAPPGSVLTDEDLKNQTGSQTHIKTGYTIYQSFTKNLRLQSQNYAGRLFLIEEEWVNYNWELTGEVATIADLPCRKAVGKDAKGRVVEAWFTDRIPFSAGPDGFHGLPGLILKISKPGFFTIEAQKITFVTNPVITAPTEGERIKPGELQQKRQSTLMNVFGGTTKN
jgi:GLPGLI family protein